MSDVYAPTHIPKSLPIHGMALTSNDRKIKHNKVVVGTQTSNIGINQLDFPRKVGFSPLLMCSCLVVTPPMHQAVISMVYNEHRKLLTWLSLHQLIAVISNQDTILN